MTFEENIKEFNEWWKVTIFATDEALKSAAFAAWTASRYKFLENPEIPFDKPTNDG